VGLRLRLSLILSLFALLIGATCAFMMGSVVLYPWARDSAEETAMTAIQRSAEMFMVSTKRYNRLFEAAATEEEKEAITSRWQETIIAVDDAIIHNFGRDKLLVRLIGDVDITGAPPFGGEKTAITSEFERVSLQKFSTGDFAPAKKEDNGIFRIAIPLTSDMHPGCANCHGIAVEDKIVLGSLNAYVPLHKSLGEAWQYSIQAGILLIAVASILCFLLYLLFANQVVAPLQNIARELRKFSKINMENQNLYKQEKNEIKELENAVHLVEQSQQQIEAQQKTVLEAQENAALEREKATFDFANMLESRVNTVIEAIMQAVSRLHDSAGTMSATAQQTTDRSQSLTSATNKTSLNVQTVASAAEQLDAASNEIGRQVEAASQVAQHATEQAATTQEVVNGLSGAADRIGEVISMIQDISGQTNLLALNATIEAARAGELGKGFAVVASEVKHLADQAAKAASEVAQQVSTIQDMTGQAVTAMSDITHTISDIHTNSSTIAGAVEQQSAAINEISRNVQEAADRTKDVASDIEELTEGAEDTLKSSQIVEDAATELAQQANELKIQVHTFLTDIQKS